LSEYVETEAILFAGMLAKGEEEMKYLCDYHVHAHRGAEAWPMKDILAQNENNCVGLNAIGYVAHMTNLTDELELAMITRNEIREIICNQEFKETSLYFALEASLQYEGKLELMVDQEFINRMGFAYVIAGAHWPFHGYQSLDQVVADYHAQNLFLAGHPLVDIVAHPWWWYWGSKLEDGTCAWQDSFEKIPFDYHKEFADVLLKNDTAVEINFGACLIGEEIPIGFRQSYLEYLKFLKSRGVTFSLGSDTRAEMTREIYVPAWSILAKLDIEPHKLWNPLQSKTWLRRHPEWVLNYVGRPSPGE